MLSTVFSPSGRSTTTALTVTVSGLKRRDLIREFFRSLSCCQLKTAGSLTARSFTILRSVETRTINRHMLPIAGPSRNRYVWVFSGLVKAAKRHPMSAASISL